jgi:hypothetical protein
MKYLKTTIFFLIVFSLLLSVFILNSQEIDEPEIQLKRLFRSAEYCGQCHGEEFNQWQISRHSKSLMSENFQRLYQQSIKETNGETRKLCLRCHAPAAYFNSDFTLDDVRNRRPVNCEVCHSLITHTETLDPVFDTSDNLFSKEDAKMGDGHNVIASKRITQDEFCSTCHTAVHPGDKFLSCAQDIEYNKWKEITGKFNVCQDCHMRGTWDNVTHLFPGSYNTDLMEGSLDVRWNFITTFSGLKARVILYNSDVGHKIPAGMTLKRLIVRISLLNKDSETIYKQDAQLGLIYQDREGIWPVMPWKAKDLKFDNSISPLEKRMITFNLPSVQNPVYISLDVIYSHYPDDEEPITIYSDKKQL